MDQRGDSADDQGTEISNRRTVTSRRQSGERISRAVIETVAAAKDRDPVEMDPLYEYVDPDALDQLYSLDGMRSSEWTGVSTTFSYHGCTVTISPDEEITVFF